MAHFHLLDLFVGVGILLWCIIIVAFLKAHHQRQHVTAADIPVAAALSLALSGAVMCAVATILWFGGFI